MKTVHDLNFDSIVKLARAQVICDMCRGIVPCSVRSYSELHDYVDANYYGGAFDTDINDSDECWSFWNKVQEAVHQWLKAR